MSDDLEDRHQMHIGPLTSNHLSIRVLGRLHAAATDYWDGNWIRCRIGVLAHPFRGEFTGDLRTDELSRLRDDLARMHAELHGEAGFANLDGHLAFDVKGDGIGHFTLEGEARQDPGSGQSLAFRLQFDQTEIPAILADLDEALKAFPVLGSASE